jgi:transcriptional regulator with PAS, ATPase and Fis domain
VSALPGDREPPGDTLALDDSELRLIGNSAGMRKVRELIARVAPTDSTVLICGESGCGKELVAESVHAMSPRAGHPFVAINCAAIPATLIEAELFGHERGSFTGAMRTREGVFERANGGTLLLDEITEMPLELQSRLLRVLETKRLNRVGGSADLPVDVRVIASTNRLPAKAFEEGRLREDIYYRLAVVTIELPRCASGATTSWCSRSSSWASSICARGRTSACPRTCASASCGISGRATYASCATPWNGRISSATTN